MILIKQVLKSLQTEHKVENPQKTAQKITGQDVVIYFRNAYKQGNIRDRGDHRNA